jgi:hypothetical protein
MMASTKIKREGREGLALLLVIVFLAVLMIGSTTFYSLLNSTLAQAHAREQSRSCLNLAEAGIDKALAELRRDASGYHGERETVLGNGRFTVEVKPAKGPQCFRVTSTGLLRDGDFVWKKARIVADISLASKGRVDVLRWSEGRS